MRKRIRKIKHRKHYCLIPLLNNDGDVVAETKVDKNRIDDLIKITWYYSQKRGYVRGFINKKHTYLHRYLMNCPKGKLIDHINENRLDNRLKNLRIADKSLNGLNIKKSIGVILNKGYWEARITINRKQIYLGQSKNKNKAIKIYKEYKKNYVKRKINELCD